MPDVIDRLVTIAFELALNINREQARKHVERLKLAHPSASSSELAHKLISRSRFWAAASGLLSGLPSNPFIAAPASLADMAALLRIEVNLAARIALIYDRNFLDSPDALYELLPPIFGLDKSQAAMQDAGQEKFVRLNRSRIKKLLGRNGLSVLRDAMLKLFGVQVLQRGIVSKTLPVAGGLIGGGANWRELVKVGQRVVSWFEESDAFAGKGDAL